MKNLLFFSLLSGSLLLLSAVLNTGYPDVKTSIEFTDAKWSEIVQLAKDENKIIFLDIYATWCGPCKLLKKTTFTNEKVGTFFNANFINATFDGEKGEGQMLAKKYSIRAYPTLLFIHPDGSAKKIAVGYHSANQLLAVGKELIK